MKLFLRPALIWVILATVLGPASPAGAATISVTTTVDEFADPGPGIGCSLREGIQAANMNTDFGGCTGATAGPDTISLAAGTYPLTLGAAGEDANAEGDLDVSSEITIDPTGVVVIDGTTIDRVFHVSGTLTLGDLTIRRGNAPTFGGGIYNIGTLTLTGSTLTDNVSTLSGGAISNDGTAILSNVTLTGNRTLASGGGLSNADTATLNNVTVANNTADDDANGAGEGGGVFIDAGTVTLSNTIVGDNTDKSTGADPKYPDCQGTLTSQDYNLIENVTGCTITGTATGNVLNQDPQLEPLRDNGGLTGTHALKQQSAAVDAGNPAAPGSGGGTCAPADQRGVTRPQGPRCDIGSFELQLQPPPPGVEPKCLGKKVTIVGTDAPDTILGTKKADSISSLGGDDVIVGLGAGDRICAGDGNDQVKGRSGDDQVLGQAGNDTVRSGGGGDTVKGGAGNDRLRGQSGDDILKGGGSHDRINGGGGFDLCRGGPGPDRVRRCES